MLISRLANEGHQLLVADENLRDISLSSIPTSTTLLTNRFDLYQQAQDAGLICHFNDFRFDLFQEHSFDRIYYRVSKEKPVVHHIINQAKKYLKHKGQLILIGAKNEGIKTYIKNAEQYFSCAAGIKKSGSFYCATLTMEKEDSVKPLDDKNYAELRMEISDGKLELYSKPGIFGWNKIDKGSQFLCEHLASFIGGFPEKPPTLLDLGCGYGYLSAYTHQITPDTRITATDNNAAAITACEKNFALLGISGNVVADDCAGGINETFTAVICNPPFHQGFATDGNLTDRFMNASFQRLTAEGKALFVVNEFVPLEKKATGVFRKTSVIAKENGFKLVLLEK
ncbi:MAG: methyltransferase [Porticoccaceae bacterium]|nr:class I SAM-dependent methyltransferase [Pseudomonadales bacterium]MCP5172804.1 class I SAM-dependent methyltransferase [Pseudomonadales bacterium]